jgi:hypothetical protein
MSMTTDRKFHTCSDHDLITPAPNVGVGAGDPQKLLITLNSKQTVSYVDLKVNFHSKSFLNNAVYYCCERNISLSYLNESLILKYADYRKSELGNKGTKIFASDINHIAVLKGHQPVLFKSTKLPITRFAERASASVVSVVMSLNSEYTVMRDTSRGEEGKLNCVYEEKYVFAEDKKKGFKDSGPRHRRGCQKTIDKMKPFEVRNELRGVDIELSKPAPESDEFTRQCELVKLKEEIDKKISASKVEVIIEGTSRHRDYLSALVCNIRESPEPKVAKAECVIQELCGLMGTNDRAKSVVRWMFDAFKFAEKFGYIRVDETNPEKVFKGTMNGYSLGQLELLCSTAVGMYKYVTFDYTNELVDEYFKEKERIAQLHNKTILVGKGTNIDKIYEVDRLRTHLNVLDKKIKRIDDWEKVKSRKSQLLAKKEELTCLKQNLRDIDEQRLPIHKRLKPICDLKPYKLENRFDALKWLDEEEGPGVGPADETLGQTIRRVNKWKAQRHQYFKKSSTDLNDQDMFTSIEICLKTENLQDLFTNSAADTKWKHNSIPKMKGRMLMLLIAKEIALIRKKAYKKNIDKDLHNVRGCTAKYLAGNLYKFIKANQIKIETGAQDPFVAIGF